MATIQSSLRLQDRISPVLQGVVRAQNAVITAFHGMGASSAQSINVAAIKHGKNEIQGMRNSYDAVDQEIKQANNSQNKFNQSIRTGNTNANGLFSTIKRLAFAVGGLATLKMGIGLSDELVQTKARLDMVNDGMQDLDTLQKKIFSSAQDARGNYLQTSKAVAQLGMQAKDTFSSNDETIKFTELLNKTFAISGTSAQGAESVMYNMTQALSSGVLRGQDLNAVLQNTPQIVQSIADYMGVARGEIRGMAEEGLISAEIVKNAMFASANDIEAKFKQMPKTFGQIMTSFKNQAIVVFDPVLMKLNEIFNSSAFQEFVSGMLNGLALVANAILGIIDIAVKVYQVFADNWSWISPIIYGIVAALLLYKTASIVVAIANGIAAFSEGAKGAAMMLASGATVAATAAQYGLNAALYACPLVWIIALVIIAIAAFFGLIAVINKVAGTSISALGLVTGVFAAVLATIWNYIVAFVNFAIDVGVIIINLLAEVANFLGNVFVDPINSVARLFFGLADTVLSILQALASGIDAVFGTSLASGVQGWRDSLGSWVDATFGKGNEIMAKINADDLKLKRWDQVEAYHSGYAFGENLQNSISDFLDFGGVNDALQNFVMPNNLDYNQTPFDESMLGGKVDNIDKNTDKMAKAMDISNEELKYLREIAEREVINRYTIATLNIDAQSTNTINSADDIDGVVNAIGEKLKEELSYTLGGIHV